MFNQFAAYNDLVRSLCNLRFRAPLPGPLHHPTVGRDYTDRRRKA